MKLNNKGVTTVEILVSFIIASLLVISLYTSVVALKDRETIASYKQSLTTYKDLLTRDIQSDIIEKGLVNYTHVSNNNINTIELIFKNNERKKLVIDHQDGINHSISYGYDGDMEVYKLPDLGSDKTTGGAPIYSLKIENVEVTGVSNIFDLKIILFHPDLGSKYSFHIVSPINF